MGVACLELRGENFRGLRKNRETRESFLPRKFPAIRYAQANVGKGRHSLVPRPWDEARVVKS